MKIEKMDINKVRVVLTEEDLDSFDITLEHLTPESAELHTFLFKIMEQVKLETGFNPYNGQIIVEAKPSNNGITLMVTKIEQKPAPISRQKIKNIRAKKKTLKARIYRFDKFEALCSAMAQLPTDVLVQSVLYRMDSSYYLAVSVKEFTLYHTILSEFCDEYQHPDMYEAFLKEHSEVIAEHNALVAMAEKSKNLY